MPEKTRNSLRYRCAQKAVLLSKEGYSNLGIITNIGNGGFCMAVIGSARAWPHERVEIMVMDETFICDIVNKSERGLHCRFEKPIGGPDAYPTLHPRLAHDSIAARTSDC
ncbi:hypothetical protein [Telmatospirillum siberiense]|nr:hypothetical protein [Telmatospirillum siberiense]